MHLRTGERPRAAVEHGAGGRRRARGAHDAAHDAAAPRQVVRLGARRPQARPRRWERAAQAVQVVRAQHGRYRRRRDGHPRGDDGSLRLRRRDAGGAVLQAHRARRALRRAAVRRRGRRGRRLGRRVARAPDRVPRTSARAGERGARGDAVGAARRLRGQEVPQAAARRDGRRDDAQPPHAHLGVQGGALAALRINHLRPLARPPARRPARRLRLGLGVGFRLRLLLRRGHEAAPREGRRRAEEDKKKAKTGGGGGGGGGGGSGRDLCRRWAAHEVDSKNRKCPDGSKCKYRHAFRKGERKETERREKKRH